MKKNYESFIIGTSSSLLSTILWVITTAVASRLDPGGWAAKVFSLESLLILIGLISLGLLLSLIIYKRILYMKECDDWNSLYYKSDPPDGYEEIDYKEEYKRVLWPIYALIEKSVPIYHASQRDSLIKIGTPPLCKSCKTELEEIKKFLLGYQWKCPSCSRKLYNRYKFLTEADSVEKRVRSKIRTNTEKKDKENLRA